MAIDKYIYLYKNTNCITGVSRIMKMKGICGTDCVAMHAKL